MRPEAVVDAGPALRRTWVLAQMELQLGNAPWTLTLESLTTVNSLFIRYYTDDDGTHYLYVTIPTMVHYLYVTIPTMVH